MNKHLSSGTLFFVASILFALGYILDAVDNDWTLVLFGPVVVLAFIILIFGTLRFSREKHEKKD